MPLSERLTQITEVLANDLAEGRASRQVVGVQGVAFGYVGGLPVTIASFVQTAQVEGLTLPVTRVTPSGTPVAVVAEGAAKPNAVTITSGPVTLPKHAGLGIASLEGVLSSAALIPAIVSVLGAGAMLSFEASAMATLDAGSGVQVTGSDWVKALVAGQAAVLAAGGVPSVAVVSAADYPTLIGVLGTSAGFTTDASSAVGGFFGSGIHVSPKLAAGKAFVMDASAALAVENVNSPVVTVDPFTLADHNQTRVVADLFATLVITNAAQVAECSIGAGQTAEASE